MTHPARSMFAFHGPMRVPFVFAAMFAATIMPCGFASAQPDPYGAIDALVVQKSEAADLVSPMGAKKFRSTILALELLAERVFLAGGLRLGKEAQL